MKTIRIECPKCKGTGLYQGMAERDGAYVICTHCHGQGYTDFSYEEFTEKKKVENCKRVYDRGCGYVITDEDIIVDGKEMPFSKYGCTYEEWLNGVTPKPIEFLSCPNYHTDWRRPCKGCDDLCIGESYKKCPHYSNVEKCWEEYNEDKRDR